MADLTPVKSSNLKAVGYDPAARALTVQFHSGVAHRYAGVDPMAHAHLMAADSIGGHFHRHIKDAYQSERVDAGAPDE